MKAKDFATWLRQEHLRAAELSAVLRDKVAAIPRAGHEQWLVEVRESFDHLRAHFQKHMALEERDGYLTTVTEHRPTLSGEVELLRNEHRELGRLMDGIHQALHDVKPADRLFLKDCCARVETFLGYIEQHESRENALVLSVFTHDIGTRD